MTSVTETSLDALKEGGHGQLIEPLTRVWLLTDEQAAGSAMIAAVLANPQFAPTLMPRDLGVLMGHLDHHPGSVVVVDIDPDPRGMLIKLEPIISRHSDARFVALSSNFRPELILEAMQVGARHFLAKQSIQSNLAGVLDRLITSSAVSAPQGAVITVLSAGGGSGATTVAVNMANELRRMTDSPSLLIDLDNQYGAAALVLGLTGQFGVADVLADGGRIDAQLISSTTRRFDQSLHTLLSPVSVNFGQPRTMAYDNLEVMIDICRNLYRYVVVDAPRVSMDVAARLAQSSRATLIVLQMSVKDVRTARSIRNAMVDRGVPGDRVRYVINRYMKRDSALPLSEVNKVLGTTQMDLLANDYRAALAGVNLGRLLADVSPRSKLRQDLCQLAETIQRTPVRSSV